MLLACPLPERSYQRRAAVARLNFRQLSRQQRASSSAGDREKLDDDFKKDIEERQAALASAAPNLKALEQYNEAKARAFPRLL